MSCVKSRGRQYINRWQVAFPALLTINLKCSSPICKVMSVLHLSLQTLYSHPSQALVCDIMWDVLERKAGLDQCTRTGSSVKGRFLVLLCMWSKLVFFCTVPCCFPVLYPPDTLYCCLLIPVLSPVDPLYCDLYFSDPCNVPS